MRSRPKRLHLEPVPCIMHWHACPQPLSAIYCLKRSGGAFSGVQHGVCGCKAGMILRLSRGRARPPRDRRREIRLAHLNQSSVRKLARFHTRVEFLLARRCSKDSPEEHVSAHSCIQDTVHGDSATSFDRLAKSTGDKCHFFPSVNRQNPTCSSASPFQLPS